MRTDLTARNDQTNRHQRAVQADSHGQLGEITLALAPLYEVIVRREDHQDLALRVRHLEQEVGELKKRLAA